jgi:GntR family transcriptional regulator, carbon starvation induced regulator
VRKSFSGARRLSISAPEAPAADRAGSLASSVYVQLRQEIVSAQLLPGEKLGMEILSERYQVGTSPVREALNRLSTEGLVVRQDQKGFRVAPVSVEDLLELSNTRCQLNEIVVRESIKHGDDAWEEAIVLAFHRLSKTPVRLPGEPNLLNPKWSHLHRNFHATVLSACRSRWFLEFSQMLFDYADRYRNLSSVRAAPRDAQDEHRTIMQAFIDRDAERAVSVLNAHIARTTEVVRSSAFVSMP